MDNSIQSTLLALAIARIKKEIEKLDQKELLPEEEKLLDEVKALMQQYDFGMTASKRILLGATMYPSITRVEHLDDYRLKLTFTSGESGVLDLAHLIIGSTGTLKTLQDVRYFAQFKVDPVSGKVFWPNGMAIALDVLYGQTIQAETVQPALLPAAREPAWTDL